MALLREGCNPYIGLHPSCRINFPVHSRNPELPRLSAPTKVRRALKQSRGTYTPNQSPARVTAKRLKIDRGIFRLKDPRLIYLLLV